MVEVNSPESRALTECLYQDLRHAGNAGEVNVVTAPHCLYGFLGLYEFEFRHIYKYKHNLSYICIPKL
jgi:hypothetical protein